MIIKREGKEYHVIEKPTRGGKLDQYILFRTRDFESARHFLAKHGNKDAGFELVEHGTEGYDKKKGRKRASIGGRG